MAKYVNKYLAAKRLLPAPAVENYSKNVFEASESKQNYFPKIIGFSFVDDEKYLYQHLSEFTTEQN
jgi:hypothetical protein